LSDAAGTGHVFETPCDFLPAESLFNAGKIDETAKIQYNKED
jgi:hypothetical protein